MNYWRLKSGGRTYLSDSWYQASHERRSPDIHQWNDYK